MPLNILLPLLVIVVIVLAGMLLVFLWTAIVATIRIRFNIWQAVESKFEPCEDCEWSPDVARILATLSDLGFVLRGHWHSPDNSHATGRITVMEHPRALDVAKVMVAGGGSHRQVVVAFQTRYDDGTETATVNNRAPSGLPSLPEITLLWLPEVRDTRQLYRFHAQLREYLERGKKRISIGQDPVAFLIQGRDRVISRWVETGYFHLDEGRGVYRHTWKGAVFATCIRLWPVRPLYRRWRRRSTNSLLGEVSIQEDVKEGLQLEDRKSEKSSSVYSGLTAPHPVDHASELPSPAEAVASYQIHEAGKPAKNWTLSLSSDYFWLESDKGELHEVHRSELRQRVETIESNLFLRRVLVVTFGRKKVHFQLSPESFAAVNEWIGPPTREDLKRELKKHLGWLLPIGCLFVLTALPVGNMPGDPISFGLGLTLILTAMLPKFWPHRSFFALESLWFSFLAANSIWLLIHQWGWMRLVWLMVQLMLVRSGWRSYRRFAPERMQLEEEAA